MVTFQVKVSCTGKIHPLAKVYLAKARFQDEEAKTKDGRKEIQIREKDLKEAAGPCWLPYDILYKKISRLQISTGKEPMTWMILKPMKNTKPTWTGMSGERRWADKQ